MNTNEMTKEQLIEKIEELEQRVEELKQELGESVEEVESIESDSKDYEDAILEHEEVAEKAFKSGANSGKNTHQELINGNKISHNLGFDLCINKAWLNYKIEARL